MRTAIIVFYDESLYVFVAAPPKKNSTIDESASYASCHDREGERNDTTTEPLANKLAE